MLTRRTATVTISAPDASSAAAFCSKLLYLPVPTISREVKVRPATLQVSPISAAADEGDDLIIVAILDRTSASVERGTISRLRSTATLAGSSPSSSARSAMLMPGAHAAVRAVDPDRDVSVQNAVPGWITLRGVI